VILWVVGAGGLFGSSVVRAALRRGDTVLESKGLPWANPDDVERHLRADFLQLQELVHNNTDSSTWGIVWAAGSATTASSPEECAEELRAFTRYLAALRDWCAPLPMGRFFLASSAGGVYGGSEDPPFSSETPPRPLGSYGRLKLRQEEVCQELLSNRFRIIVGRIANLYGPGQDTSKLQGLVSRLCLASITRQTMTIFVPVDTLRDFIYVDDAAILALHWTDVAATGTRVRIIATGEPMTLGHVISTTRDVVRTQIPLAHGLHASASAQALDIRLTPDRDDVSTSFARTPLPVGIRQVYLDLLNSYQGVGQPARAASLG
jgi:UDP-glucose 4-epimerase